MKKLLFLGACLVALASQPVMAQTTKAEVVIVRLEESNNKNARAVIARPNGKTEEVVLNGALNGANLPEGTVEMQRLIAGLYQEGYSLKSTFSSAGGFGTTLVFTKEK